MTVCIGPGFRLLQQPETAHLVEDRAREPLLRSDRVEVAAGFDVVPLDVHDVKVLVIR